MITDLPVPNGADWSDKRPRMLCVTRVGHRATLTATEDVVVEDRRVDALGAALWAPNEHWGDLASNINLDIDPWLNARFDAVGVAGALISDGEEMVSIPAHERDDGRWSFGSRGAMDAFRLAAITRLAVKPANAWIVINVAKDADAVKCALIYRLIGGDPDVAVTLVPVDLADPVRYATE